MRWGEGEEREYPFAIDRDGRYIQGVMDSRTTIIHGAAHGIPHSDRSFQTVITELKSACAASSPRTSELPRQFDYPIIESLVVGQRVFS